jgi:hypothetical protein
MLDLETASSEDALVNADLTMYDAKLHGRNRVAVYSPETREDILEGADSSERCNTTRFGGCNEEQATVAGRRGAGGKAAAVCAVDRSGDRQLAGVPDRWDQP